MISPSSYYFFKAEYESILEIDVDSTESKFEKILNFSQFVSNFVIPAIKERTGFSVFNKTYETKRIYIQADDGEYLISFKEVVNPEENKLCFVGIRWNIDTVITKIIKPRLAGLTEETGLEFQLNSDNNINLLTGVYAQIPEESLSLSFSNIPFPWSLVAIQPGYEKLESDSRIQMIIYRLL